MFCVCIASLSKSYKIPVRAHTYNTYTHTRTRSLTRAHLLSPPSTFPCCSACVSATKLCIVRISVTFRGNQRVPRDTLLAIRRYFLFDYSLSFPSQSCSLGSLCSLHRSRLIVSHARFITLFISRMSRQIPAVQARAHLNNRRRLKLPRIPFSPSRIPHSLAFHFARFL